MSLYHEAAAVLEKVNKGKTSLKAEIFGKKTWKTDGKVLFALTSEAAKWSSILAEVVEKSGILKIEKQVCVLLECLASFVDVVATPTDIS
jgi:putative methyltransferase